MIFESLRKSFLSQGGNVTHREKLVSGVAAFTGILVVALISETTTGSKGLVFMAVSMGSAAVLLFAIPHSPMAQPWSMIGGHLVSALVGVLSYKLIASVPVAAATAVATAIVGMFLLRCINPPGAAAALGAVLGGPVIHDLGFFYILVPVGLNVLVIIVVALIVNNLLPGRRYPLRFEKATEPQQADLRWALGHNSIDDKDLDEVMENLDTFIDVGRDELKSIYQQATLNAYKRRLGPVTCADIMTAEPLVLTADMNLGQVRDIMMRHHRVALPVVDDRRQVIGLLTQEDLLHDHPRDGLVTDIMRPSPEMAYTDQHVLDIVPLISEQGWRTISVVDRDQTIQGIITRSDIIRALLSIR